MSLAFKTLIVFITLTAVACSGDDGRSLSAPDVTTTIAPVNSAPEGGTEFVLSSPDFNDLAQLPEKVTVSGGGSTPWLQWENPPEGTASMALLVMDLTNESAVHWLIWNIDPSAGELPQDMLPAGATEGQNSFGEIGWAPPTYPTDGTHSYVFELHALAGPLFAEEGAEPMEVLGEIYESSMTLAELTGVLG